MINSVYNIAELLLLGEKDWTKYGMVNTHTVGNLTIFNYNNLACQGKWNFFERVSRGLIINNKTGDIVARPFDKFFNYGERGLTSKAPIKEVWEKMDGSLGISYIKNGEMCITTRGNLESPQGQWATEFLHSSRYANLHHIPSNWTLLFEIIYPENRIVVDYEGEENLVLLAAREIQTGRFIENNMVNAIANNSGFSRPHTYSFRNIDDIIKLLPDLSGDKEGFVIEFEDGQRFKFKGKRYLELHKLISGLSFKNTIPIVKNNIVDEVIEAIPNEFQYEFIGWVQEINSIVQILRDNVEIAWDNCPKDQYKKEFAIYAQQHYKELCPILFAMWDNKTDKEIESTIWKVAFKDDN